MPRFVIQTKPGKADLVAKLVTRTEGITMDRIQAAKNLVHVIADSKKQVVTAVAGPHVQDVLTRAKATGQNRIDKEIAATRR